jgi:hypothetical protein
MTKPLLFISVFNLGGVPLALNHLESLRKQNIQNYRAYVTDQESYDIVSQNGHPVELVSETPNQLTKDKSDFGTTNFNTLSYTRYKVILDLLVQNQPVWYLDVDTVVLQNLNEVYDDMQGSTCDAIMQNDINMLCTGCMLLFPKLATIKLMRTIYDNRTSADNDQIILLNILRNNPKSINIMALNMVQFPNGLLYFNELSTNSIYRDLQLKFKQSTRPVYFVHANWMVGIETKIDAFKKKGLWFV